jgi:hypothetical protein
MGMGFDYTFINDNEASAYSQWAGWRRILSTVLREGPPGLQVDNRQSNHEWGPWMCARSPLHVFGYEIQCGLFIVRFQLSDCSLVTDDSSVVLGSQVGRDGLLRGAVAVGRAA